MRGKLPFVGRVFWIVLPVVFILVIAAFFVAVRFFDYSITRADYGGAFISAVIFSYLLHLWLLSPEYPASDEELPSDEE